MVRTSEETIRIQANPIAFYNGDKLASITASDSDNDYHLLTVIRSACYPFRNSS